MSKAGESIYNPQTDLRRRDERANHDTTCRWTSGCGPPSDPDSERALIAAAIVDASQLARVADLVSPADFADPDLGRLYEALQTMCDAGLPIGDARFLSRAQRLAVPESVRSAAFLARLIVDGGAHAPHAVFYAGQIRRAATLRRCRPSGWTWRPLLGSGGRSYRHHGLG